MCIWIKPVLCSRMVSLFHHTSLWTHTCLQFLPSAHRNGRIFRRSVQTACCYWILNREKLPPIEIHRRLEAVYGDQFVDVSTVRRWVRGFKDGELGFKTKHQFFKDGFKKTSAVVHLQLLHHIHVNLGMNSLMNIVNKLWKVRPEHSVPRIFLTLPTALSLTPSGYRASFPPSPSASSCKWLLTFVECLRSSGATLIILHAVLNQAQRHVCLLYIDDVHIALQNR